MRSMISEIVPVCSICGLAIQGHLFKHVASTTITPGNSNRAETLIKSVRAADWVSILSFQDWDGLSTSVDVVGLKCVDERCSLAVLLCPAQLEEPYALMLQALVSDCDGPLANGFWGSI